ncbi:hypothetical protein [Clostridium perfringens]|uniref:hypothetical protein n=1 Tax=Clostridium perfringens TaxID=1502 RepID=UPI002443C72A|nr:hypothetical protein [Clostridium perfringens]MDG6894003.1 hypothetical protein [Clostridium perfringens]
MKPILFNTAMVRAILDGEKTCTRRIIKKDIPEGYKPLGFVLYPTDDKELGNLVFGGKGANVYYAKPPYKVGDILYVRETWNINPSWEFDKNYINLPSKESKYIYKATNDFNGGWKPSIHMPKEAARIFLKVTSVRAERLKDIDEEQAKKEGARKQSWYQPFGTKIEDEQKYVGSLVNHKINYKTGFADIWDSTVKEEKYSWEGNPWVWVIGFKRIEIVK